MKQYRFRKRRFPFDTTEWDKWLPGKVIPCDDPEDIMIEIKDVPGRDH